MKKGTRVTSVAQSSKSTLRATKKIIQAVGWKICIKEDAIEYETDIKSGLTKEVIESLKNKTLYTPETAEYYVSKYPCRGIILSVGHKCKLGYKPGEYIAWGRGCEARHWIDGRLFTFVHEYDVLGYVLND